MTAKEKFRIGQRVRMTQEALDRGLDGPIVKRSKGVVKRFPKKLKSTVIDPKMLVTILRRGDKTTRIYHMDFWEPVE